MRAAGCEDDNCQLKKSNGYRTTRTTRLLYYNAQCDCTSRWHPRARTCHSSMGDAFTAYGNIASPGSETERLVKWKYVGSAFQ